MSDCCKTTNTRDKHLVIIGGGSAAFSAALKASELGHRATIVNAGLPTGGTCVNVGCVPSKFLIRAAEQLHGSNHARFAGIKVSGRLASFRELIAEKRSLVAELRQAKYINVIAGVPGIRLIEGKGRLLDSRTVEVNGECLAADAILIATGVRTSIPQIPGLAESGYLTNESLFELDDLPESLIVLGGRFVALECVQMMARLGSHVTVLQRSERILPSETADITDALTGYLRDEGIDILTGVAIKEVRRNGNLVSVRATIDGKERNFKSTHLLAATGRKPNTDGMGLEEARVPLDAKGFVRVDEHLHTGVSGIFAAGDVIGENQFVYTAAYEGALAAENVLTTANRKRDYSALPWVVFTDPQVAGVGLDEEQARKIGIDAESSTLPLSHVPRSIAARDTRGFIRLVRNKADDRIIGARFLAPEGSELCMEAALAIRAGMTAAELASMFHAYLTLSEGVKLAAITFGKSVEKLSCCAS